MSQGSGTTVRAMRFLTSPGSGTSSLALAHVALIALALFSTIGCQRRVRYTPPKIESTAADEDSSAIALRRAQEQWEAGDSPESAAEASALALFEDLRDLPPTEWSDRAGAVFDSLAIGAEISGSDCGILINFFQRSDPTAGSWPYVFWCGAKGPVYQKVEGRGLKLGGFVTRGLATAARQSPERGAAALFSRHGPGGQQPLLMVWEAPGRSDQLKLIQTLGPDSIGGVGTAEFETIADTVIDVVARTYRQHAMFNECSTCPHVYLVHRFRWGLHGFERLEQTPVASPYSTFVEFIEAMRANDIAAAVGRVADPSLIDKARRLEWARTAGTWRIAPAADETPQQMVFFRGEKESYRVQFEQRGGDFVISDFEAVPRSVE